MENPSTKTSRTWNPNHYHTLWSTGVLQMGHIDLYSITRNVHLLPPALQHKTSTWHVYLLLLEQIKYLFSHPWSAITTSSMESKNVWQPCYMTNCLAMIFSCPSLLKRELSSTDTQINMMAIKFLPPNGTGTPTANQRHACDITPYTQLLRYTQQHI